MSTENRFVTKKQVMDGYKMCRDILPQLLGERGAFPPLAFYEGNLYRQVGGYAVTETPALVVVSIRARCFIPGVQADYYPNVRKRINSKGMPTVFTENFGIWTKVTKMPEVLQRRLEQVNG